MMLYNLFKTRKIHPFKSEELEFWSHKWGINTEELNDAIVSTGSIKVKTVRAYLARQGYVFSMERFLKKMVQQFKNFADKFKEEDSYC